MGWLIAAFICWMGSFSLLEYLGLSVDGAADWVVYVIALTGLYVGRSLADRFWDS